MREFYPLLIVGSFNTGKNLSIFEGFTLHQYGELFKDKDLLALIKYIAPEQKLDYILDNQKVIKTPVVRNGKQATIGYQPDIWKEWK